MENQTVERKVRLGNSEGRERVADIVTKTKENGEKWFYIGGLLYFKHDVGDGDVYYSRRTHGAIKGRDGVVRLTKRFIRWYRLNEQK